MPRRSVKRPRAPGMRFFAVEQIAQQVIHSIHRIRSLTIERRTAQINQIGELVLR